MKQKTTRRVIHGSLVMSIIFGMMACNGTDSSDKTANDSSAKTASVKAADSASVVKAKKKRKGQMTIALPGGGVAKIVKDEHGVYNRAEKEPEFPGGQSALSTYINNKISYPQSDVDNGTSGTVHVSFVVDEHGKVINPEALDGKNLGDELVSNTLKVFDNMPTWTPGTIHGKKVKTRLEVPVTFASEEQ